MFQSASKRTGIVSTNQVDETCHPAVATLHSAISVNEITSAFSIGKITPVTSKSVSNSSCLRTSWILSWLILLRRTFLDYCYPYWRRFEPIVATEFDERIDYCTLTKCTKKADRTKTTAMVRFNKNVNVPVCHAACILQLRAALYETWLGVEM